MEQTTKVVTGLGVGRVFQESLLKDLTREERSQIYMEMIKTLCKIHSVDIYKAGLQNFGKQGELKLFNYYNLVLMTNQGGPQPSVLFRIYSLTISLF